MKRTPHIIFLVLITVILCTSFYSKNKSHTETLLIPYPDSNITALDTTETSNESLNDSSYAQTPDSLQPVYESSAGIPPKFTYENITSYISPYLDSVDAPKSYKLRNKIYRANIQFIVEKDGSVQYVTIRAIDKEMLGEKKCAIIERAFRNTKWIPGIKSNENVRMYCYVTIFLT